jgi:hypothetical protein
MSIAIPGSCDSQSRGEIPHGAPAQDIGRLGDVEMKQASLVWRSWVGAVFLSARPFSEESVDECANGSSGLAARPEIETLAKAGGLRRKFRLPQASAQPEITCERLENMLPWPRSMTVADDGGLTGFESANAVRDYAVGREIAAADHIPCAAGGNRAFSVGRVVGTSPRRNQKLGDRTSVV